METQPNIFERLHLWIQESITIKLMSIGFLVLVLLIPSSWIQGLMQERELRAQDAMREVSSKWAGPQTLSGPVLVIPYKARKTIDRGKEGVEVIEYTERYFFLPEMLNVTGDVKPQILHRGIFDVAVYESSLDFRADFKAPDFASLGVSENMVLWKDATMVFSIDDLRGINENPSFVVGGKNMTTEPSGNLFKPSANVAVSENENQEQANGIAVRLGWQSAADFSGSTAVKINIKGSEQLNFVPTGKITTVKIVSPWTSPSFDGRFLPERRDVTDKGFTAEWKVLHFNRTFSQQWTAEASPLSGSEFGVNLLISADQYQKSIRTSKYGQLIIILTFVALFMVEITRKVRIHPFQYILIGVALIIYYTLLISLSEQVGYNIAYWISTGATVSLVTLYSWSFLKTRQLVALFGSLLVIFYSFIFIIILQEDFSLLLGSIGLFLIVGALMYFSRKIAWYRQPTV
jgi:inner membrane protein